MKNMMTPTTLAALTVALLQTPAIAESRVWTDRTGKTIEAEQVKVLNDQVLLRLADGREIKVALDKLSAEDRAAALLNQPPSVELKVSAKTNRSNSNLRDAGRRSRVQLEEESTQVTVVATKSSSAPYEAPLTATLCVMGERAGGQPVVLEKISETFTYSAKDKEFEMASGAFESVKREGGDHRAEYKGWLVVVTDPAGALVAMKSSEKQYAENAEALIGAEKETEIARRARF